jgi:hypothetical protein
MSNPAGPFPLCEGFVPVFTSSSQRTFPARVRPFGSSRDLRRMHTCAFNPQLYTDTITLGTQTTDCHVQSIAQPDNTPRTMDGSPDAAPQSPKATIPALWVRLPIPLFSPFQPTVRTSCFSLPDAHRAIMVQYAMLNVEPERRLTQTPCIPVSRRLSIHTPHPLADW